MTSIDSEKLKVSYKNGVRVARHAIRKGVPRWVTTTHFSAEEMINLDTGLPVIGISAPPELIKENESFAQGHNDEIISAIAVGRIAVDFRPLLLTRDEIGKAFETSFIGQISSESPRLTTPDGQIELKLRATRTKRKAGPFTWIAYTHLQFGKWPEFELFREPIDFALASKGRVLAMKSNSVFWTRDLETTQVINRYT